MEFNAFKINTPTNDQKVKVQKFRLYLSIQKIIGFEVILTNKEITNENTRISWKKNLFYLQSLFDFRR